MVAVVQTSWVIPVLKLLPDRLHAALDAWSYRRAQARAERRRQAGRQRAKARMAKAPAAAIDYKLQPWRD